MFRKPSTGGTATARKRIQKEISDLAKENLGSISLTPDESDVFKWHATIPGPAGSPYEGGVFEVEVRVPDDYPFSPPHLHFLTKVYHCNINSNGAICLDLLKNAWSPALSLYKVILSLSSLLTDPNPADPLVPQIATEYKRNRKKHDETARDWVKKYAMPKTQPTASSSSPTPTTTGSTAHPLRSGSTTTSSATAPTRPARPPRVPPRNDDIIALDSIPTPPLAGTRRSRATETENGHTHAYANANGTARRGGSTSSMPIDISSDDEEDGIVVSHATGSGAGSGTGSRAGASGRNGERGEGSTDTASASTGAGSTNASGGRRQAKRARGVASDDVIVIDE